MLKSILFVVARACLKLFFYRVSTNVQTIFVVINQLLYTFFIETSHQLRQPTLRPIFPFTVRFKPIAGFLVLHNVKCLLSWVFYINFPYEIIVKNRKPTTVSFIVNICSTFIQLSHPLPHYSIGLRIFTIRGTEIINLTINFGRFHIP